MIRPPSPRQSSGVAGNRPEYSSPAWAAIREAATGDNNASVRRSAVNLLLGDQENLQGTLAVRPSMAWH